MSDERRPDADPAPPEGGGVFGNLPDARPGTRSPRRDSARAKREEPKPRAAPPKKPAAAREPEAARAPEPERPKSRPSPPPEAEHAAEPERQGGGLEDIAWAGVAAAAEAATIGVRLASRAIEALRGSPGKE